MASIFTHNGAFTVKSIKTGEHRTFRVRTQDKDAAFAPDKRIPGPVDGVGQHQQLFHEKVVK